MTNPAPNTQYSTDRDGVPQALKPFAALGGSLMGARARRVVGFLSLFQCFARPGAGGYPGKVPRFTLIDPTRTPSSPVKAAQ